MSLPFELGRPYAVNIAAPAGKTKAELTHVVKCLCSVVVLSL